tara:strand:- start:741 stop:1562 length:822 start_codon:yes stop_codon:yes gene_type:complete
MNSLAIIALFTFIIHLTESLVYTLRLAGLRTQKIATALSLITSALLISRLSNMGQAPLLGNLVDKTILSNTPIALEILTKQFRLIIFFAFLGSLLGFFLAPTMVVLLEKLIRRFSKTGRLIPLFFTVLHPQNFLKVILCFRLPKWSVLSVISLKTLPKSFLIYNIFVTAIYTIGVLCSLLAGAYLPEFRSTAIQLSGIVNGIATILYATIVDPIGAKITDEAAHGDRDINEVKSVVFYLLVGRLVGTLVIAQLLFMPFTSYILIVTKWIVGTF